MSIEISSASAGSVSASDVSAKGRGAAAAGKGNFLDLLMRMGEQDLAGLVQEAGLEGAKEGATEGAKDGAALLAQGDKKADKKTETDGAAVAALQAWMAAHQPEHGAPLQGIALGPTGQKTPEAEGTDALAGVLAGVTPQGVDQGVPQAVRAMGEGMAKGVEAAGKGAGKGRSQTQLLQQVGGAQGALQTMASVAERPTAQLATQLATQLASQLQQSGGISGRGETLGRGGAEIASLVHELKAAAADVSVAAPGAGFRQALADAGGAGRAGGAEGAWGLQALVSERMTDVSTVTSEGLATPSAQEAAVADQVSYWLANDIQKAELRLDPWGREPVEVSLFLQGNEARVEFRADVPEVRQMLEGALAQLQSALQDQGLVLAEASVGQFGTGGAGQRESSARQDQPGVRRGTARVEAAGGADIPRVHVSRTGERTVDVFV